MWVACPQDTFIPLRFIGRLGDLELYFVLPVRSTMEVLPRVVYLGM